MDVRLIDGVRTPFCKAGTAFDSVPAQALGALMLAELLERTEIDPSVVDAVVVGNVAGPIEAANVARVIALMGGLPQTVPAHTVSRNCASGLEAAVDASRRIASGEAGVVVAIGVESMSRIPVVFPDSFRQILGRAVRARGTVAKLQAWARLRPRDLQPTSALLVGLTDPVSGLNMGQTAEVLAREFGVSRADQDRYACESHRRAVAAARAGRLHEELAPIFLPPEYDRVIDEDIGPREGQSIDKLGRLPPWFERPGGTVTAGNSSMVTDGAVALLLASPERARELGLGSLGRIRSHAVVGCDPRRMGLGPAFATPLALDRAGVRLREIDLIELNEAFAAQVLACQRAFASRAFAERELQRGEAIGELDDARLNVDGGAIALGHPVGASGARLLLHLGKELKRRGGGLGLATLCVGGGQGQAVVLEVGQ